MQSIITWSLLAFGCLAAVVLIVEYSHFRRTQRELEEKAKPKPQYIGTDHRIARHRELADQMEYWSEKLKVAKNAEERLLARKGMLTISNAIHDLYV